MTIWRSYLAGVSSLAKIGFISPLSLRRQLHLLSPKNLVSLSKFWYKDLICKKILTPRQGGLVPVGVESGQVALPAAERRTNQEEAAWLTSP